MFGKKRLWRFVIGAVLLAAVECAGLAAIQLATVSPAHAQFWNNNDERYPFLKRQRSRGGFFGDLFGNPGYRRGEQPSDAEHYSSHAPPPHKAAKDAPPPTTSIVVMGDGMADWLAYGLEDAFADQPEVAVDRQTKYNSGLLRYEPKGDLDWWHVARDTLTKEKANYVVMMLGISDRESIREKDLAKEAEKQKSENAGDKKDATAKDEKPDSPDSIVAPEKGKKTSGMVEFRSDQWATIYSRRIDETIAALKSKGVPVFWVGLPSIRGAKSTADAVYLNDLYRARAERAGITYIDVWDGFVDDAGKFSSFGPDYEGQTRRLRSSDGVYFTKFGARKLAHYVEREIRRYMSNRAPIALPNAPIAVPPSAGKSTARPVAGPVVPLTTITGNADQLLGGAGSRPAYGDTTAADVLVKGEPVSAPPGRADNFAWPGSESNGSAPAASAPQPAFARTEPQSKIRQVEPKPGENGIKPQANTQPSPATKPEAKPVPMPAVKPAQATADNAKPVPAGAAPPKPEHHPPPKKRSIFPFGNPFGWLR